MRLRAIRMMVTVDEDRLVDVISSFAGLARIDAIDVVNDVPFHKNKPRGHQRQKIKALMRTNGQGKGHENLARLTSILQRNVTNGISSSDLRKAFVVDGGKLFSVAKPLKDLVKRKEVSFEGKGRHRTYYWQGAPMPGHR